MMNFAKPQNVREIDTLDHFLSLTPKERTELLGHIYTQYEIWRNEQMITQSPYISS